MASHEDEILSLLYEKKHCMQTLLYLCKNMNVDISLQKHLDDMYEMMD